MDWSQVSASRMAQAVRTGETTAKALVEWHLARIAAVNPRINAVVQLAADRALKEAQQADLSRSQGRSMGPLHGVPITIKDSLDTEGIISTGGTLGRRQHVPARDASVVARLRQTGAIVLGKTNTPELTYALETDNLVYGRTCHPQAAHRTCGGSSGGAAAIIAAGGSPLDIGSDTGGSIRLPANFCGIAGLKPTSGRTPRTGHILPFGGHLDFLTQLGPMARRVEDLALVLPLICGPDGEDPAAVPALLEDPHEVDALQLRVAWYTDNGVMPAGPDARHAVLKVVQLLRAAGVDTTEDRPACVPHTLELFFDLFYGDGCVGLLELLSAYGTTETHPWMTSFVAAARSRVVDGATFSRMLMRWDAYRSDMLAFMRHYDLIISPVHIGTAFTHDRWLQDGIVQGFSYTQTYNLSGWPALALPCGRGSDGMPVGVQIAARPWHEHQALALGLMLERLLAA